MRPHQKAFTILLTNLANILKVKTIITLVIVFTFCALTIKGIIEGKDFLIIAATVVTYYFTKEDKKDDQNRKGG